MCERKKGEKGREVREGEREREEVEGPKRPIQGATGGEGSK